MSSLLCGRHGRRYTYTERRPPRTFGRNAVSKPISGRNEQSWKTYSMLVRSASFAENSGTNPGHAESQAEKQARDQTDFSRDQFLRVNQDGGEGGGQR